MPNHKQVELKILEARACMEKALAGPSIYPQWVVKAIECYSEALDMDSHQLEAYLALAVLLWKYGEFENAARLLKAALAQSPENSQAKHLLEQIAEDYAQQDISSQISKAADSALSEQNDKNNVFNVADLLNNAMGKIIPQANNLEDVFSTLNQEKQKKTLSETEDTSDKRQEQDLLYASVESAIHMHIKRIKEVLLMPNSVSSSKFLKASCQHFQRGYDRINEQMDLVNREMDIIDLEDQFDEFESLLDQLESIIDQT